MSKKEHKNKRGKDGGATQATENDLPDETSISHEDYQAQLHVLQVELVKLQRHFIGCGDRILVLLEGRDAAGKDGSIKRIVEHLSPRETRVVALGKPYASRSARKREGSRTSRGRARRALAKLNRTRLAALSGDRATARVLP